MMKESTRIEIPGPDVPSVNERTGTEGQHPLIEEASTTMELDTSTGVPDSTNNAENESNACTNFSDNVTVDVPTLNPATASTVNTANEASVSVATLNDSGNRPIVVPVSSLANPLANPPAGGSNDLTPSNSSVDQSPQRRSNQTNHSPSRDHRLRPQTSRPQPGVNDSSLTDPRHSPAQPANSVARSDIVISFEEAGVARCKCIGAGFGLVVGMFLFAIGILFIYQIAQYERQRFKESQARNLEIKVLMKAVPPPYITLNGTSMDFANFSGTWTHPFNLDYEYLGHGSRISSGERYAGPSLAVLGAVVFLLSLSLCMWLKISGKIVVLQSTSDTSQDHSSLGLLDAGAIPLNRFDCPSTTLPPGSPHRVRNSPVMTPSVSPRHATPSRPASSPRQSAMSSPRAHPRPAIPTYDQVTRTQDTPTITPRLCRHHRMMQSSIIGGSPAGSPHFSRHHSSPSSVHRQASLRVPRSPGLGGTMLPAAAAAAAASEQPLNPFHPINPPNAPPPAYADVFPASGQ